MAYQQPVIPRDALYSIDTAARTLGVQRQHVERWLASGILHTWDPSGAWPLRGQDLIDFLRRYGQS